MRGQPRVVGQGTRDTTAHSAQPLQSACRDADRHQILAFGQQGYGERAPLLRFELLFFPATGGGGRLLPRHFVPWLAAPESRRPDHAGRQCCTASRTKSRRRLVVQESARVQEMTSLLVKE